MAIKLKVGGVYANAVGKAQPIVAKREADDYPFLSLSGDSFMENGQFHNMASGRNDLIRVISEPDAPTEAPTPDAVTTRVAQVEICAPETEEVHAAEYLIKSEGSGRIFFGRVGWLYDGVTMSPAAARAIGAELIHMAGEGKA